jgi:hypothetical protein
MRMNHLTLLAMVAVAVVAVITAGGCSQAQAPVEDQATPAPGAPTPDTPDTTIPPVTEPPAPVAPLPEPPAADAPATADLTAETLTGTTWQAGPLKIAFGPDGGLTINDTMTGSWSIDGQQLIVEGGGTEYKAQIKGDTLLYGDLPLVKIQ